MPFGWIHTSWKQFLKKSFKNEAHIAESARQVFAGEEKEADLYQQEGAYASSAAHAAKVIRETAQRKRPTDNQQRALRRLEIHAHNLREFTALARRKEENFAQFSSREVRVCASLTFSPLTFYTQRKRSL